MKDWNNVSKNISEALNIFAKRTEKIRNEVADALNNFAKTEEFQRLVEIFNNIPDDVQKTVFFQRCQSLKKKDITYEEIEWIFDELEIFTVEEARDNILKYFDSSNMLYNYIKGIVGNSGYGKREKLIIILTHFERLIYSTLKREKKQNRYA